jgi:hypothetical protein
MRRIIPWLAPVFLTLVFGIAAAQVWFANHKTQSWRPVAGRMPDTKQINASLRESEIPTVSLCDLTRDPECYWYHEVRVRATIVADGDRVLMNLLDQDCGSKPVWIEAWCDDRARPIDCQKLTQSLNQFLGKDTAHKPVTANVEVIGMFWPYDEDSYHHRLFIREMLRAEILKTRVPRPPRVKKQPC